MQIREKLIELQPKICDWSLYDFFEEWRDDFINNSQFKGVPLSLINLKGDPYRELLLSRKYFYSNYQSNKKIELVNQNKKINVIMEKRKLTDKPQTENQKNSKKRKWDAYQILGPMGSIWGPHGAPAQKLTQRLSLDQKLSQMFPPLIVLKVIL